MTAKEPGGWRVDPSVKLRVKQYAAGVGGPAEHWVEVAVNAFLGATPEEQADMAAAWERRKVLERATALKSRESSAAPEEKPGRGRKIG